MNKSVVKIAMLSGFLWINVLFSSQALVILNGNLYAIQQKWPQYNVLSMPMRPSDQALWLQVVEGFNVLLLNLINQKKPYEWLNDVQRVLENVGTMSSSLFKQLNLVYGLYIQPAIRRDLDRKSGVDVNFDAWHFDGKMLHKNELSIQGAFADLFLQLEDLKTMNDQIDAYIETLPAPQKNILEALRDLFGFFFQKLEILKQNIDSLDDLPS